MEFKVYLFSGNRFRHFLFFDVETKDLALVEGIQAAKIFNKSVKGKKSNKISAVWCEKKLRFVSKK